MLDYFISKLHFLFRNCEKRLGFMYEFKLLMERVTSKMSLVSVHDEIYRPDLFSCFNKIRNEQN